MVSKFKSHNICGAGQARFAWTRGNSIRMCLCSYHVCFIHSPQIHSPPSPCQYLPVLTTASNVCTGHHVPREALDGVVHFVPMGTGYPHLRGLFKGRYKNACRQDHQAVLSGFATHSRCCLRSLLEIRVKMYESLKPYARNTTSRIRGCESERKKQTRWD